MKGWIEKVVLGCMQCVTWGLTATLVWSLVLAAFHITDTAVPQWLFPF